MLPPANAADIRAFHISWASSSTSGWPALKARSQRRERLEAGAPRIGDAQPSELAGGRALGVLGRAFGICERPPRSLKESATGVGEPHLPSRSDEEIDPEVALELSDRGAQGWLRHVHPLSGAAEVQLLRHGDEVARWRSSTMPRGAYALDTCSVSG